MSIAQQLYEGVELGSAGSTGLITYMRTDSIRISDAARDEAARHITTAFGKEYVGSGAVRRKAARQRPGRARGDPADGREPHPGLGRCETCRADS